MEREGDGRKTAVCFTAHGRNILPVRIVKMDFLFETFPYDPMKSSNSPSLSPPSGRE
jgi:hypothetical protein